MRLFVALLAIGCNHPQSGAIDSAMANGDANGDALGDGNANADAETLSCPAGQWCQETAAIPATALLTGVWAASAGDVFAVGDAGTIIRRRNSAWTAMTSNVTGDLTGVWGSSSSNVWAVGGSGTIVHFDGTSWAAVTSVTTADLTAVWGTSATDMWIVGANTALHYNGATWSTTGLAGYLLGVSGTGPNDVWACGETAQVRHYTGTWSAPIEPIAGNDTYYAILADATNVWVTSADTGKEAMSYNGTTWTAEDTTGVVFQSLYAAAGNDVWAVGNTKAGHWNGSAWTVAAPPGVTASLFGVSGAGADVFVVGADAMILHRD